MPFAALKSRYDALTRRMLGSLSEDVRRDVKAFDAWFYRGGGWRLLFVIVGLTTLSAFLASRLPWNMTFAEAAILFNAIVLMLVWSGLSAWFGYRKFAGKLFRFVVTGPLLALAGALIGAAVGGFIQGVDPLEWLQDSTKLRHVITAALVFGFLYTLVVALIASLRNREYAAEAAHLAAERRQSELSRQLAESKLRLLQLQIEPHFLFNTLGSAQQLAEKGAPDAARLIADLIRFLRASTPSMRGETATMNEEGALIAAYLAIMQARLGARLRYAIDVPTGLSALTVPPGMLITLVENAIKHGIEPLPAGGAIDVTATRAAGERGPQLIVTVADTGAGIASTPAPGQGIGLANIRERLALLYGDRAELALEENEPRGFVARLSLPIEGP
jgi:signal transduction histidine kinase